MTTSLDQRIGGALADTNIAAADLGALFVETENALVDATTAAAKIKADALDPLVYLDAAKARSAVEDAEFRRDRLQAALPRLKGKYDQRVADELVISWRAERDAVEQKVLLAAKHFERVPDLIAQLVDIFAESEAVDREVSQINASSPSGEMTLRSTELEARNISCFSRGDPSLVSSCVLFGANGQLWPRRRSMVDVVAPPPAYDARFGADWAEANADHRHAVEAEQARIAEHYAAMTKQQSEREQREEDARRRRRTA